MAKEENSLKIRAIKIKMIEDIPVVDKDEKKKRKVLLAIIIIICALSIIITMIIQIKQLEEPKTPPSEDNTNEQHIPDFLELFDNKINYQGQIININNKSIIDNDIIFTSYAKKEKQEEDKYEIDVKIPEININNSEVKKINKEIRDIFQDKAEKVLANEEEDKVIYTVEYSACVNSNILSLVIKSTLKEGANAQRVIVKGYTYNISTGTIVTLNDLIGIKQMDKNKIKNEVTKVISENAKQNESLINLGYHVYERNLKDTMYEVDNIDNFYYGPDGAIYLIFAYGNNNFTSELDIVPIV